MKVYAAKYISNKYYPNLNVNFKSAQVKETQRPNKRRSTIPTIPTMPISAPELLRRKISADRIAMLKPIRSQTAYEKLFKNIIKCFFDKQNQKNNRQKRGYNGDLDAIGEPDTKFRDLGNINFDGYEHIDFELKGLVPYCGTADISRQMNCWLTARKDLNPCPISDREMANIIRAFEYSLRQLDKIYGTVKGTVFRAGYFNPLTDKQYYSASDYLSCTLDHSFHKEPSKSTPYSIIKIKNGHDIYNFQRDTGTEISSVFAYREREVLIDRKSLFRQIPKCDYTSEDSELERNIIYQTIDCNYKDLSEKRKKNIYENISIWEEI